MTSTLAILLLLLGSVVCDVSGQVCFKLGVGHETADGQASSLVYKVLHSPWIALGVAVYAVEFVLWFSVLSRAQLIALDTPDALKRIAISPERPDPTMEDAFIHLVESADSEMEATA